MIKLVVVQPAVLSLFSALTVFLLIDALKFRYAMGAPSSPESFQTHFDLKNQTIPARTVAMTAEEQGSLSKEGYISAIPSKTL